MRKRKKGKGLQKVLSPTNELYFGDFSCYFFAEYNLT